MNRKMLMAVAGLLVLMFCSDVFANGIIVPPRPRPRPRPPVIHRPVRMDAWVKEAHLKVTIDDQIAKTEVNEVFVNPNNWPLEGDFVFPLPADATVNDFSFWMNGKEVKAELLDAKQAQDIYTDIVRRMKDPALLEYVGTKMFRLRIFPIAPNGEAKVKLTYSQLLKSDTGLITYRYPHSTNKFSSKPLESATVDVTINSKVAIKNVYCPSHSVDINRKGDNKVRLSYEGKHVKPEKDFIVYYTTSNKDFGLNFLTFREKGEDGYFLALLTPKQEIDKKDILPKDIVFVLDTSGSMSGKKIEQAKASLTFCVNSLNAEDRFNIVSFATGVRKFKDDPIEATKDNVEKARKWIDEISARGGTNINDALKEALKSKGSDDRTYMVVFMTDGQPTIGETDPKRILKNIIKANERKCRLFVFGVGHDVNTILLDKLAEDSRGARDYITPEEDIEIKISNFYDKVANPVLTNAKIEIKGLEIFDVYPKELPDLFKGSQIAVVGRYKGNGHKAVKLLGKVGKVEKEFVYEADFPEKDVETAHLARVWATSKVGYLLDEMRLHGESNEVRQEVVKLAKEFGILTPYTSYLVVEDERNRAVRRAERFGGRPAPAEEAPEEEAPERELTERLRKAAGNTLGKLADKGKERSGEGAVQRSKAAARMKDAAQAPSPAKPQSGPAGRGGGSGGWTGGGIVGDSEKEELKEAKKEIDKMIKKVGSKTFYLSDGVWYDSKFKKGMEEKEIEYLSDEYFELIKQNPEYAKYFAVAENVVVTMKEKAFRIKKK